jgi:hypothetical protein
MNRLFASVIVASLSVVFLTQCSSDSGSRNGAGNASRASAGAAPIRSKTLPGNPGGLPFEVVFQGRERLAELERRSRREGWWKMSMADATAAAGMALRGVPYENFTLEIDDHIEACSVNLEALDCWTMFEIALALAQMSKQRYRPWTPEQLLREVEYLRYRGGRCDGNYLSRIHYLAEWWVEAERKGVARDITRQLPGAEPWFKEINAMSSNPSLYRYLRMNPQLLPEKRRLEAYVQNLPVWHVPKERVAAVEHLLKSGDIVAITTHLRGEHCSHIGLAYRDSSGVLRFLHASKNHGRVVLDGRLSDYLNFFSTHAGIMVARPLERDPTPW